MSTILLYIPVSVVHQYFGCLQNFFFLSFILQLHIHFRYCLLAFLYVYISHSPPPARPYINPSVLLTSNEKGKGSKHSKKTPTGRDKKLIRELDQVVLGQISTDQKFLNDLLTNTFPNNRRYKVSVIFVSLRFYGVLTRFAIPLLGVISRENWQDRGNNLSSKRSTFWLFLAEN